MVGRGRGLLASHRRRRCVLGRLSGGSVPRAAAAAAAEGPGRRRGAVRRPPRHRRDVGTTAWRWGSLTARFGQHGHVVAEMYPTHWLIPTQVNDGVQNKEESYGKFEEGNKLALADFAARVDAPANWLEETLIPRMEAIMRYTIDAAHARLNPKKRQACFELLGFDFMLDADLRVDLIEINSNPCLETWSCPLLEGLIPKLVDDVLRVGLDQILPPPSKNLSKRMSAAVEAVEAAGHDFVHIFGPSADDAVEAEVAEAPAEPASEPTAEPSAGTAAGGGWVKRVDPDTGVAFFVKE